MLTPQQFKEITNNLAEIVGKQERITSASLIDDSKQGISSKETLLEVRKRLLEDNLRVLVMGKFSSGKSTFLNAMMGKMLLPAKPTPTTAVIGEIQYADEPGATLYPKKGMLRTGDEPFNIKVEDLAKYIVIDHSESTRDEDKKPSPYEKIVIKYPLHICKMGIEFVDSPGLDDPTCHDSITLNYLPIADAILYCMNSQSAFSARDKVEIERLRALGYKSIIFVLTYFDMLEQNDEMTGRHDAEDTRRHYINVLSPYTDLGADGIFFVGSLPALVGKVKGNKEMLEASHMPPLEKKLEQILFNERGRLKLIKAVYSTKKINRETGRYVADVIELGKQDKTNLASKLNDAQHNLDRAKEKANLISVNFSDGINELIRGTEDRTRIFFTTEVLPNVEDWINGYVPSDDESISVWHPKRSGRAFSEGCMKSFQSKLETVISSWCSEKLIPDYIEPKLRFLANQQNKSISAYETDLQNVRGSLSMSIMPDEPEISGINRILSAIAGVLLLNPAAAITGGSLGWRALVPTLISTIVANIILYIVAYFTGPIGWATIIIANIVVLIAGGAFGGGNIESKVKKKIATTVAAEITRHQEEFVANVSGSIKEIVYKLKNAVDEELNNPVNQYQSLLNEARKSVNAEGATLENRIVSMSMLLKDNIAVSDELEDFAQNININL